MPERFAGPGRLRSPGRSRCLEIWGSTAFTGYGTKVRWVTFAIGRPDRRSVICNAVVTFRRESLPGEPERQRASARRGGAGPAGPDAVVEM